MVLNLGGNRIGDAGAVALAGALPQMPALEDFDIRDRGHSYGHLSQINLPAGYPPLIEICSQALIDRKPRRFNFETEGGSKILSVAPLISAARDTFHAGTLDLGCSCSAFRLPRSFLPEREHSGAFLERFLFCFRWLLPTRVLELERKGMWFDER